MNWFLRGIAFGNNTFLISLVTGHLKLSRNDLNQIMCGILGQILLSNSSSDFPWDQALFESALHLQHHRGPDNFGVQFGSWFALGHQRLRIIDLSTASRQPMQTEDDTWVIVFNGEIYNFNELRTELEGKGVLFKTKGDTEVLLKGVAHFGISFVEKCIGMFAFCIIHKPSREVFIVRDRMGIKPLYYYQDSLMLTFSSEIKSILKLNTLYQPEINPSAVSSYLSFRYPILNQTFFKNIYSLAPGHILHIKNGQVTNRPYYDFKDSFLGQANDLGASFYIQKIREKLKSAVQYRMVSDVPFGAFLSGGVDSSVVTALMAQSTSNPIRTFSIGFEEEGFNEFNYAHQIAEQYKTIHSDIRLTGDDYFELMQHLIHIKDAPLSVPNEAPLYLMSKHLKQWITVVLSGEGADELFGGYGRLFRSTFDYERLARFEDGDSSWSPFVDAFKSEYGNSQFPHVVDHFLMMYRYTSISQKRELLHPDLPLDQIEESFRSHFIALFDSVSSEYLNKILYAFQKVHLVGLLHRVDTATMAASVEARVPFVDHRVVELANSIPSHYKLRWNNNDALKTQHLAKEISEVLDTPKYVLKKAFEPEIPRDILYRRKMGFPVPLNHFFGNEFNQVARDLLGSEKAKSRGIYNTQELEKWLDPRFLSHHGNAMKIWMLVNLELFFLAYFDTPRST